MIDERFALEGAIKEIKRLRAEAEKIRVALGGYPDSDLASLATTLRVRNETLEARVAELEAFVREAIGTHGDFCDPNVACGFCARGRALLSPKPAPLPDLTFDADDPLPDMTPAPIQEPKCGEGGAA